MARTRTVTRALMASTVAAVVAAGLGGCSYANYPPIGTAQDDAAVNDPNAAPVPTLTRIALEHVVERFPVEGDYVINLPEGMTRRRAEELLMKLWDERAHLPAAGDDPLPVYHVTRVWLRPAGRSEVEILRPVFGVGTPGDRAEYQPVSVYLRHTPLEQWKVDTVRVWPIGSVKPPPLYGWQEAG